MKSIENFADLMIENSKCKETDKDIIIYGLTMAFEIFAMIITIIFFGSINGLVLEGLLFFVSFSAIRTYAGGYHCQSGKVCYIASSVIVLIFFTALKYIHVDYMVFGSIVILIITAPTILKLAPLSTKNNPLDDIAKIHFRKKVIVNLIVESIMICILLYSGFEYYAFVMSLGVLVSGVLLVVQKSIT